MQCKNCKREAKYKAKQLCKKCYDAERYKNPEFKKKLRERQRSEKYKAYKRRVFHGEKHEEILAYHREWKRKNYDPEKMKIQNRKTRLKQSPETRQKWREYKRKYQKEHPEVNLRAKQKQMNRLQSTVNIPNIFSGLYSWSKTVKKRDENKCQICGEINDLQSHHIIYKNKYPQLMLNENNGITLCLPCHNECHGKNLLY